MIENVVFSDAFDHIAELIVDDVDALVIVERGSGRLTRAPAKSFADEPVLVQVDSTAARRGHRMRGALLIDAAHAEESELLAGTDAE